MLDFYPKDNTPGCTIEANEFSAQIDQFTAVDTVVLGVSKDGYEKHQKFISKYSLKVDLLADTGGELCELYGTWGERKFMGKTYMGIGRSTFVIDKQGILVEVNYKVKAKGHAQAMLTASRADLNHDILLLQAAHSIAVMLRNYFPG